MIAQLSVVPTLAAAMGNVILLLVSAIVPRVTAVKTAVSTTVPRAAAKMVSAISFKKYANVLSVSPEKTAQRRFALMIAMAMVVAMKENASVISGS